MFDSKSIHFLASGMYNENMDSAQGADGVFDRKAGRMTAVLVQKRRVDDWRALILETHTEILSIDYK